MDRVRALVEEMRKIYADGGIQAFFADNMIAMTRTLSFAREPAFVDAFAAHARVDEDHAKVWRLHTYCWAAKQALKLPGDFVECGVFRGFYAAVMTDYLDFKSRDKTLWLYDTFDGLAEEFATEKELALAPEYYTEPGIYEAVVARFAAAANVRVIRGVVPTVFDEALPEQISFLHLDLNSGVAETAALDRLFGRICEGGYILLDDFGRLEFAELHLAHVAWFAERGLSILELPTGQGLVVKRS